MLNGSLDVIDDLSDEYQHAACFIKRSHQVFSGELLQRITMPASDRQLLNAAIAETFATLKSRGVDDPVLIGAIPFDVSRASSLNFYRRAEHGRQFVHGDAGAGMKIRNKRYLVDRAYFEKLVRQALEVFSGHELTKIVLSQAIEVEFLQGQKPSRIVQALLKQNPDAYTFAVPVADHQFILGASPELLLSRQGALVASNPLAGSRPKTPYPEENGQRRQQLRQSAKDQREHRIVVDNVVQKLAPYCFQLSVSEHPELLETPTMLHLSSSVQGRLRADAPNALSLALELHPTPAVCGTPTALAKRFILDHEGYDRHYYAGLVGWMDARGDGEWVVTIRCGLLDEDRMRLYAGAGIVSGSDADAEWLETEAKMRTMLNAFNVDD